MRIYDRSPDPNVTAVDAILQAELAMYVPYGNTPSLNGGDDLPGALFVSTNPTDKHLYFKAEVGGAFIACATLDDISSQILANSPPPLIKNQTNLLPDGLGNWYLAWLDNTGQPITDVDVMPLAVTVNGITQPPFQLNRNFTPARMYGFSDTIYPQNIKIYISKNVTTTLNTVAFQNITGFTGTSTQVIKGDGSLGSFPQPLYEAFNLMTNVPRVLNMQLTGYNRVYIFTGGTADVDVLPATGNTYRNTGFFINENNSPINLIGRFRVNGALQTVYVLSANTAKTYIIGSGITQDIHII